VFNLLYEVDGDVCFASVSVPFALASRLIHRAPYVYFLDDTSPSPSPVNTLLRDIFPIENYDITMDFPTGPDLSIVPNDARDVPTELGRPETECPLCAVHAVQRECAGCKYGMCHTCFRKMSLVADLKPQCPQCRKKMY